MQPTCVIDLQVTTMKVTYSGEVEWRSPRGYLIQFEDSGEITVTGTTATVSNLIPSTRYQFKVSAITANGRGGEMSSFGTTQATQNQEGTYSNCISLGKHDIVIIFFLFDRETGLLSASIKTSLQLWRVHGRTMI